MSRSIRLAGFALLVAVVANVAFAPRGITVPLYAARTGLMCQSCHFDPNGGGPRNEFGFMFEKNRHTISADTTGEWKDLELTNRVSDTFPLYFGVNHRFMLLADQLRSSHGPETTGFYDMESALYMVFQPHPKLTLVYSRDGFGGSASTKDAFGLIGLPHDMYLKAGQFRTPFGLRMDDHTVATRNSFLDFQLPFAPQALHSFLPYDPRQTDPGVEVGGTHGSFFGRVAFTEGGSNVFGAPPSHAQAVTAKLGTNLGAYQGAVSIFDDYTGSKTSFGGPERSTRWSYYALTHVGPFVLLGEAGAGTDVYVGTSGLQRVNQFAAFAELDYSPHHPYNLRLRYDRLGLNRASDPIVRDLNTWNRFAIEGEWDIVPFAQLRWTARLIDPVATKDPGTKDAIPNEKQGYLQLHFAY